MTYVPQHTIEEYKALFPYLTPYERDEIDSILGGFSVPIWTPFAGPQSVALESQADELFYGGAAGGGKTDLILGAALTRHWRSVIFRREYAELKGIRERAEELYGDSGKFNGQLELWRIMSGEFQGSRVEFGACQFEGDERKFQGRPHDLKGFDEITQFLELQYRFLITWNRTAKIGQRVRVIAAGNPPVNAAGQWVIKYWGPWLDPTYPRPAKQGELRWFITIPIGARKLEWVDTGKDIPFRKGETMDLEVERHGLIHISYTNPEEDEDMEPKSRTFIRARVEDNPRLMETGYRRTLQALPEPLRSRMLRGDFGVGQEDDEWQLIPTEWILQAQARWAPTFGEFLDKQEKRYLEDGGTDSDSNQEGEKLADNPTSHSPSLDPSKGFALTARGPFYPGSVNTRPGEPQPPAFLFNRNTSQNAHVVVQQRSRQNRHILPSPKSELENVERLRQAQKEGAIGVDVSRGGKDDTTIAERLENWFADLKTIPGRQVRTGQDIIQILIELGFTDRRIQIDVHGVGTSPFDIGTMMEMDVVPMAGSMKSQAKDRSGKLGFTNLRSEWHWKFREALEPGLGDDIALPPDPTLLADLTSIRWSLSPRGIAVEEKKFAKARIGRSPDRGDAVVLAHAKPHISAEAFLRFLREQVKEEQEQELEQEERKSNGEDSKSEITRQDILARRGRTPGSSFRVRDHS